MKGIESVRAQIRFYLNELAVRNEHHSFERLCMELSRRRICLHLLPATGPVSAGGDQGRDFESYRSYLNVAGLDSSVFIGLSKQGPLVFACSTQEDSTRSKIKEDVERILSRGERPERIYFFSAHNLAVAKRHQVQDEIRSQYGVELEVFDAQAIADQLSEPDTFWIAQEYLHLPAEVYPVSEKGEDEWYKASKVRWEAREPSGGNYQEFDEIRRAARHAASCPERYGDLGVWMARLKSFRQAGSPDRLQANALYETIVAKMRALWDLRGHEEDFREHFNKYVDSPEPWVIGDLSVLLNVAIGASRRFVLDLGEDEIRGWHQRLVQAVDHQLKADLPASTRCLLLDRRGSLHLFLAHASRELPAVTRALDTWEAMLSLVPRAPLYPLQSFTDHLNRMIDLIGDHPKYPTLVRAFDDLIGERLGQFAAAQNAFDRAVKWHEAGHVLRAIDELHQTKVKWFAEETLLQSILTVLILGQWYEELGLSLAGKYYTLAAVGIASQSAKAEILRLLPKAMFVVANLDYSCGASLAFLMNARAGLALYSHLGSTDPEKQVEDLHALAYHATLLLLFCEYFDLPDCECLVNDFLQFMDFAEAESMLLATARSKWPSSQDVWKSIQEQLTGPPFDDSTTCRRIRWSALGVQWDIKFQNDYETTALADEFIALAQILATELTGFDLCIPPTSIRIDLDCGPGDTPKLSSMHTNDGRYWRVTLPEQPTDEQGESSYEVKLIATVSTIVREISFAPSDIFSAAFKEVLVKGLRSKTFVWRPYRLLFANLVRKEEFAAYPRNRSQPPGAEFSFSPREHPQLAAPVSPGPGYDHDEELARVRARYEKTLPVVRHTLDTLRESDDFCAAVRRLLSEGWKEWHILMAVASIAVNARVNAALGNTRDEVQYRQTGELYMNRPESPDDSPLAKHLFSEISIRSAIRLNLLVTARGYGLDIHQRTPDVSGIERLLIQRYRFKDDDVEHEAIFGACGSE